jgi:hypothetical protein
VKVCPLRGSAELNELSATRSKNLYLSMRLGRIVCCGIVSVALAFGSSVLCGTVSVTELVVVVEAGMVTARTR